MATKGGKPEGKGRKGKPGKGVKVNPRGPVVPRPQQTGIYSSQSGAMPGY